MAASEHSNNSVPSFDEEIPVPRFMRLADKEHFNLFKSIWIDRHLTVKEKIASIDVASVIFPIEIRKEYRIWRYQFVRDITPDFAKNESPKLQDIVRVVYRSEDSLDGFANALWEIKDSFKCKRHLFEYLNKECLTTVMTPFLDSSSCKSVTLSCQHCVSDLQFLEKFNFSIDISTDSFGCMFAKLVSGENYYGANDDPININGCLFNYTDSWFSVSSKFFILCIPFTTSESITKNLKTTRPAHNILSKTGDVYMGIDKFNQLNIIVSTQDGLKVDDDANFVGRVVQMPYKSMKKNGSYVRFQILTCNLI